MRVKGGIVTRRKHKKVLRKTKGYRLTKGSLYKVAHEAFMHAGVYSLRDRRHRTAQFRRLWITRINSAVKAKDVSYNKFINAMKTKKIIINRKILSELIIQCPETFDAVFSKAMSK